MQTIDNANPPADWDFWREGLHRSFTTQLYRRASLIGGIAALLFLGFDQRQISLGLVCGLAVALFSVWTVEVTVRLLFNGGQWAGLKLAIAAAVKLPFLLGMLIPIAQLCTANKMNPFAVVGGVLLAHGVMLMHVIATALAAQDKKAAQRR
jgi:hypothetical protein